MPSEHEDPLDPQLILSMLPEREREPFLASYRTALSEARDPAGWQYLRRVLRLWRMRADALRRPGFIEEHLVRNSLRLSSRKDWQKLWADVADTLHRAADQPKPQDGEKKP